MLKKCTDMRSEDSRGFHFQILLLFLSISSSCHDLADLIEHYEPEILWSRVRSDDRAPLRQINTKSMKPSERKQRALNPPLLATTILLLCISIFVIIQCFVHNFFFHKIYKNVKNPFYTIHIKECFKNNFYPWNLCELFSVLYNSIFFRKILQII